MISLTDRILFKVGVGGSSFKVSEKTSDHVVNWPARLRRDFCRKSQGIPIDLYLPFRNLFVLFFFVAFFPLLFLMKPFLFNSQICFFGLCVAKKNNISYFSHLSFTIRTDFTSTLTSWLASAYLQWIKDFTFFFWMRVNFLGIIRRRKMII